MINIGSRIRTLRENKNISQKDLANRLNIANSTLSQYESGARIPSDDIKIKIANFFGVTTDYLFGLTDEIKVNTNEENEKIKILAREANDLSDVQLDLIRSMIKEFKEKQNNE